MSANSDLIKDRLAIFIGNYLDCFFEVTDDRFAYCVEYLFMNLFSYKSNEGIAHECADALNDIFSIKKISIALSALIGKYLPKLTEGIQEANFGLYFDVIHEIVLNLDITNHVLPLFEELCKKIQSVYTSSLL
jgi:hypothetical protein